MSARLCFREVCYKVHAYMDLNGGGLGVCGVGLHT